MLEREGVNEELKNNIGGDFGKSLERENMWPPKGFKIDIRWNGENIEKVVEIKNDTNIQKDLPQ